MYTANELDSTVTLYDYDVVKHTLYARQSLPTIPSDSPENIVADIHITPSGTRVYFSSRGHNSIAIYDVGTDGSLTLVSIPSCGGNWPRNFALSPSGRFMLVANQRKDEISVLPILNGKDGIGVPVARVDITGASSIQFVGNFNNSKI